MSEALQLALVFVSLFIVCRAFMPQTLEYRGDVFMQHLLYISTFSKLVSCCLHPWSFAVSLWRVSYWVVWAFHGTPLGNNSIRYNPLLIFEALFADKKEPVRTVLPWLFWDFIPSMAFIYFQRFPLYYVAKSPLKCPLILVISPSIPSLNSTSSRLYPFIFPLPFPGPQSPHKIYSFNTQGSSICSP